MMRRCRAGWTCALGLPPWVAIAFDEGLEHFSNARGARKLDAGRHFVEKGCSALEASRLDRSESCSGGDDRDRRGAGEEGEGGEGAGGYGEGKGFEHGDDGGRRRGGGGLHQVDGYMGGRAEGAVGVGVGAVGVGVGDLCGAGNDHQKDAEQGEEESPCALRAKSAATATHTRPL